MSVWNRPLFGTGRARELRPHSEAGKRLARVRVAHKNGAELRIVLLYHAALMAGGVVVLITLDWSVARSALPAGAALPPFWTWFREQPYQSGMLFMYVMPGGLALLGVWGPAVFRWHFDRQLARSQTRLAPSERAKLRRKGVRVMRVYGVVMTVLLLGMVVVSDWQVSIVMLGVVGVMCAPVLIPLGIFKRRGRGLRCARCDYRMMSWRGDGPVCPECGLEWRKPWNLRWGARCISWPMVLGGAGITLLGAGAIAVAILSLAP